VSEAVEATEDLETSVELAASPPASLDTSTELPTSGVEQTRITRRDGGRESCSQEGYGNVKVVQAVTGLTFVKEKNSLSGEEKFPKYAVNKELNDDLTDDSDALVNGGEENLSEVNGLVSQNGSVSGSAKMTESNMAESKMAATSSWQTTHEHSR
jgi:hypothetical protein